MFPACRSSTEWRMASRARVPTFSTLSTSNGEGGTMKLPQQVGSIVNYVNSGARSLSEN